MGTDAKHGPVVWVTPSEVRAARRIASRDQDKGRQTPEAIRKIAAAEGAPEAAPATERGLDLNG